MDHNSPLNISQQPASATEQNTVTYPNPLGQNGRTVTQEDYNRVAQLIGQSIILNVPDEQEPPALFTLGGVEVICKQSLCLTSGWKKAGKSNWSGLLMAASAHPEHSVLNGQLQSIFGEIKIVTLDTEQPLKDARRTYRRVMQTAGFPATEDWTKHGIFNFSVKDFPESDVYVAAEILCKQLRPDLLIIDGIADIMQSINKEDESKMVFKWAAWLAQHYDCAVMCMLHLNQGSEKIGGWAGTQGGKKYTDGFIIKKENGCFTIEHEGRGESAPKTRFRIESSPADRYGRWVAVDCVVDPLDPEDRKLMEAEELVAAMPLPCDRFVVVNFVKDYYRRRGKIVTSDNTIKAQLTYCKKHGLLDSCRKKGQKESVYFRPNKQGKNDEINFEK